MIDMALENRQLVTAGLKWEELPADILPGAGCLRLCLCLQGFASGDLDQDAAAVRMFVRAGQCVGAGGPVAAHSTFAVRVTAERSCDTAGQCHVSHHALRAEGSCINFLTARGLLTQRGLWCSLFIQALTVI